MSRYPKPAGPASDIYSLGIILYEMLTSHLPFDADNAIGIAMQHLHSEPPPPAEYNPELSPRASAIVMRALEKDPEHRYRDAGEFAAALATPPGDSAGTTTISPILEPVRQTTAVYRPIERGVLSPLPSDDEIVPTRQFSSSNRLQLLALVFAALLLIGGLAAGAFFLTGSTLGGGSSPATSTATPKPTATPRNTPTATTVVVVFTSTSAPVPTSTRVPSTATATPVPPPPTKTPVPVTPTPTPGPAIIPIGPTSTPTNTG